MAKAWLSLGANIGDPSMQLREAMDRIDAHPRIAVTARSALLTTKPWGKTDQPDFVNAAIGVDTDLAPEALLDALLAVERDMGRVRDEAWGPRRIDIDIIAYDREVIRTERLKVPHPHAHERAFVLDPLGEIAPEVRDWILSRPEL